MMMKPADSQSWEKEIQINRTSNRPLYLQVKEGLELWIMAKLSEGSLSQGDRLPSENELSDALQISNITIKRSLDELRRQGLIQRIQGRGTFVTGQNRLTFDLPRMFSLTSYTEESGMRPARKILEMSEHAATPAVAQVLRLAARARVIRLVRLRLVDQVPVAVDTSYLPLKPLPDFIHVYRDGLSLYELMDQHYGRRIAKAHDTLEPALIQPFEARVLEVPSGTLGISVERIGYDAHDRPLEFTTMVFRGDLCMFSIDFVKENHGRQSSAT
ncbi:MAG TPA: GntR family transcriptional regulator [Anaerolineales bacterium]|nr:GntR family transcriptional regulator [Anaerolineales bacterium]